jgi:signal transduction histidine kinase
VLPPKIGAPGPPAVVELLIDTDRRIVSSDDSTRFPVGADAALLLPAPAATELRSGIYGGPKPGAAAVLAGPNGKLVWSLVPIEVPSPSTGAPPAKAGPPITAGYVYLQMPPGSAVIVGRARIGAGALVLALTLPVGVAFGLFTTRRLRRRLRDLADASQAVADGAFTTRVTPGAEDEVGRLERNFNDMAARLGDASRRELELASQNATLAERSRISRELHDSISQDLFSLAMLAGGLERAVPADSPLQGTLRTISETIATAIQETRALVLDLHPSALVEKGLAVAVEDLCASYRTRLGIDVVTELEPVDLDSPGQHAMLRIAQEALGNAARHADARAVTVALRPANDGVELVVADDGQGFDPSALTPSSGFGLRLMRERVTELGGRLEVDSAIGRGTSVRVTLPLRVPVP